MGDQLVQVVREKILHLEWPRAERLLLVAEHRVPFPPVSRGVKVMTAWEWMLGRRRA